MLPQAAFVLPALQVPFSQQPCGQLVGVHTHVPPWHSRPAGQATQATPPLPQAWLVLPPTQCVMLESLRSTWQQPVHVLGSHAHLPFWHFSPAIQAVPQLPQFWLVSSVTHWFPQSVLPVGHSH